jgi:hypothetical protein
VLKGSDHQVRERQRSQVGKICQDNSENVKHRHFRGVIVILDFGSLSALWVSLSKDSTFSVTFDYDSIYLF